MRTQQIPGNRLFETRIDIRKIEQEIVMLDKEIKDLEAQLAAAQNPGSQNTKFLFTIVTLEMEIKDKQAAFDKLIQANPKVYEELLKKLIKENDKDYQEVLKNLIEDNDKELGKVDREIREIKVEKEAALIAKFNQIYASNHNARALAQAEEQQLTLLRSRALNTPSHRY